MHFSGFSWFSVNTRGRPPEGALARQLAQSNPWGFPRPASHTFLCRLNLSSHNPQSSRHGYIWAIIPPGTSRLLCKALTLRNRCFKKCTNRAAETAVRVMVAEPHRTGEEKAQRRALPQGRGLHARDQGLERCALHNQAPFGGEEALWFPH